MTGFRLIVVLATATLAAAAVAAAVTLSRSADDDPDPRQDGLVAEAQAPAVVLSPSGLPVGLLESKVTRSAGDVDVSTVRLVVRADDTGGFSPPGGHAGDGAGGYPVVYTALEPGRVRMSYDGIVCAHPRALVLAFLVDDADVTITGAERHGCLVGADLAADLVGAVFRLQPPVTE